jgi:hypothetical protein
MPKIKKPLSTKNKVTPQTPLAEYLFKKCSLENQCETMTNKTAIARKLSNCG